MTHREKLTRQMRRLWIVPLAGLVALLSSIFVSRRLLPGDARGFVGAAGLISLLLGSLALQVRVRCPRCRGALGGFAAYLGAVLSFPKRIRFCPYCGFDLDTPVDEPVVSEC